MESPEQTLSAMLRNSLADRYGQIIGGADLASLLGFRSSDTLRKAICNKTLTLRTFAIPGRQGRFALTVEVADWLVALRNSGTTDDVEERHSNLPSNDYASTDDLVTKKPHASKERSDMKKA